VLQVSFESRFSYRKRLLSLMADEYLLGAFAGVVMIRWVLTMCRVGTAKEPETCSQRQGKKSLGVADERVIRE